MAGGVVLQQCNNEVKSRAMTKEECFTHHHHPKLLLLVAIWLAISGQLSAWSFGGDPILNRRCAAGQAALIPFGISVLSAADSVAATTSSSNLKNTKLQSRFQDTILVRPPVTTAATNMSGVDNLLFPERLLGTWNVTQTLLNVQTPLGLQFLSSNPGVAQKSLEESQARLHQPVHLQLRFVSTKWGVVEDRVFNTAQRLNAFAGRAVVSAVDYANVSASNRQSILNQGGTPNDPLQTVFVRFRGPAAQKIFVTSYSSEVCGNQCWMASEGQRSIFALTNENTAPPVVTDSEVLYEFNWDKAAPTDSIPPDSRSAASNVVVAKGRLRIASYLNPMDPLYFDAKNRAVSIQDYSLELRQVVSS